jgi:glycosyltransferase involved in cell wall biosynthesis
VKILFIDQFSEMGGAQRVLIDTIDAVQGRGREVYAAVPGGGPLVEQLRTRGVAVTGMPCGPYRSHSKNAADLFRFAFDLRRQIRTIRNLSNHRAFDLLYVNGPRLLPAAAFACPHNASVLFHAHSHVRQAAAAKVVGWSIRHADAAVVACSNSVLDPLRSYAASDKLHVIPNGVAELNFRERLFSRGRNWCIGMIGRISREKGQAEFLQAAALIAREFDNARFAICGAPLFGDTSYEEVVHKVSEGLPVEFLGWREDVGLVFATLDLLVVPSQEEGMGRVIVEAFSAGVPVVAFPTGGIPEVVVDGETGFLTKGTSPEALAARLREVISSGPDVLRRVAANARKAWERSYALARYQERITAVMESLVSASPAERETRTPPARR